ncbi:MAG: hypothetical protein ACREEE_08510 [Dongiaceae bacterium]
MRSVHQAGGKILYPEGFAMLGRGVPIGHARWLALAVAIGVSVAAGAAAARPYEVSGVNVDVTAADSATARDQAIIEGQRTALQMLVEDLVGAEKAAQVPLPNDDAISAMVQDFEVETERLSSVRYIGVLTFRFDPILVDDLLSGVGGAPGSAVDTSASTSSTIGIPSVNTTTTSTVLPAGPVRTLAVSVPIGGLQDWLEIRRRLSTVAGVRTEIRYLARDEARLNLLYSGNEELLSLALAQRQLQLSQAEQQWVLGLPGSPIQ